MMREDGQAGREGRALLLSLYATYGADRGRWSKEARALAPDDTLDEDREIIEARTAARALDSRLDEATRPQVPPDGAERAIRAVLERTGGSSARAAAVVAFPAGRRRATAAVPAAYGRFSGVTALAASLVLGFYVGAAGLADDLIPSLFLAEDAIAADYDVVEGVIADLEEDLG